MRKTLYAAVPILILLVMSTGLVRWYRSGQTVQAVADPQQQVTDLQKQVADLQKQTADLQGRLNAKKVAQTATPTTPTAPVAQQNPPSGNAQDRLASQSEFEKTRKQLQQGGLQTKEANLAATKKSRLEAQEQLEDLSRRVRDFEVRISLAKVYNKENNRDPAVNILRRHEVEEADIDLKKMKNRLEKEKSELR